MRRKIPSPQTGLVANPVGIAAHQPGVSETPRATKQMSAYRDNEWVPPDIGKPDSPRTAHLANGACYHPTVWNTLADLAAYDDALQASTHQIENSFGGALPQDQ